MNRGQILVVDDDRNILELMKIRLESANYLVATAADEDDASRMIKDEVFDIAIVDLQLVRSDGIELMQNMHMIHPDMPVIILTAYGTIESAVNAMKKGAYSYLTKPFDGRDLLLQIEKALEKRHLTTEINRLKGIITERYDFSNIIARSRKMQEVLEQVIRIAGTDSTIYISGDSGTGKELIAKATHLLSERKDKSFVDINCAAIPESLLESELFGHEKGAFTGAIRTRGGLFTQANGGTVFLDEIGDMPLSIQAKLLRVLQERRFYPIGSKEPIEVNVRLIVATNKDLEKEVAKGQFREDLFYRIHVIPIFIPSLKERKEDIPPLVDHFLKQFSKEMNKKIKGITPQAMQQLMLQDWPGNVRQLKNTIEYAVAMTLDDVITEDLLQTQKEIEQVDHKPLKEAKAVFERSYIVQLMDMTQGNVSKAAQLAGKYRADFYNLLKKYDISPTDFKK
ncbi:MAG TPA: sigma-54-dependent Fis family transcriptional regulator [Deltaproteobacteria bacterium]|nr:sigma-54-dependent Fis family transcriptional regulator [Deltaproteobacteria bacterium]